MTPTGRTLERLRRDGFCACVVEQWIPRTRIRRDAFGVGDILAAQISGDNYGCWLIQTTSRANHAARRRKALGTPSLQTWWAAGGRFAVASWGLAGERGRRKTWNCWFEELTPKGPIRRISELLAAARQLVDWPVAGSVLRLEAAARRFAGEVRP